LSGTFDSGARIPIKVVFVFLYIFLTTFSLLRTGFFFFIITILKCFCNLRGEILAHKCWVKTPVVASSRRMVWKQRKFYNYVQYTYSCVDRTEYENSCSLNPSVSTCGKSRSLCTLWENGFTRKTCQVISHRTIWSSLTSCERRERGRISPWMNENDKQINWQLKWTAWDEIFEVRIAKLFTHVSIIEFLESRKSDSSSMRQKTETITSLCIELYILDEQYSFLPHQVTPILKFNLNIQLGLYLDRRMIHIVDGAEELFNLHFMRTSWNGIQLYFTVTF